MNELVLPEPGAVTLPQVRELVLPAAEKVRRQLEIRGDLAGAREMCRRLEAFRKYLQDREGRDLLACEVRRTEALIGDLLGPVDPGERTDLKPSLVREGSGDDLNHNERFKFRVLSAAKRTGLLETLLEAGVVGRDKIVEKYTRLKKVEEGGADLPEVRAGDFRTALADIPDNSVSLILTDPPYAESALPLYSALGALAARVLVPGGSLICYAGKSTMRRAGNRLAEHLREWWLLDLPLEHGGRRIPGKWVISEWRPVWWFVKEFRLGREYIADRLRGSRPE
jgi:hypothetical protein